MRTEYTQSDCDGSGKFKGCETLEPHAHCIGRPTKVLVGRMTILVGSCLSPIFDGDKICEWCKAEARGESLQKVNLPHETCFPSNARYAASAQSLPWRYRGFLSSWQRPGGRLMPSRRYEPVTDPSKPWFDRQAAQLEIEAATDRRLKEAFIQMELALALPSDDAELKAVRLTAMLQARVELRDAREAAKDVRMMGVGT